MYGSYNNIYNRPIGIPTQPINSNQYIQPPIQQPIPYAQPQQSGLQGKAVDNIEVVKVTDIPLDGSISYFPLTDGSAIVTKQLQNDGTSKTTVYEVVKDKEIKTPKYATIEDIKKEIETIDLTDIDKIKEDINEIKKTIREMKEKRDRQ